MNYLLDTCVLSELVKIKPEPNVITWIDAQSEDSMYVSSITIGELLRGIARLHDSKRKTELITWVNQIREGMANRILPFDHSTADSWAEMCADAEKQGKSLSAFDSLIAGTALKHNLAIVTRNTRDFEVATVKLINPWLD